MVEDTLNKTSTETAAELIAVNNVKEVLEKEKQVCSYFIHIHQHLTMATLHEQNVTISN